MSSATRPLHHFWVGCFLLLLLGCSYPGHANSPIAANPSSSSPAPVNPSTNSSSTNPGQPNPAQASASEIDPDLIAANTRFGFKLFSQLRQQNANQNVLISPASVSIALTMTYNGANGETQQEMAEALELQNMSLEEINTANQALMNRLQNADPDITLSIANSLWGRNGFAFKPDFLKRNQDFYNAEVTTLDFASPEATTRINDWVSQATQGKIPQVIDQIDPNEVLFLANAIYFKGNWSQPFSPDATRDQPFYPGNGAEKSHPLMSQRGQFSYYETEQFQAISLPYGERSAMSLYVFLPKPNSDLNQFYTSLTPENWNIWRQRFTRLEGTVKLPKFKIEYSSGLKDALATLGMTAAFDRQQADFSQLTDEPAFINRVEHKTFMEVNEAGTEAAATTTVGISVSSYNPKQPFNMVIDRPFFYVIQDQQTGSLLFMGAMVDPQL